MNLEQVQEIPNRATKSGELFRNDERLQPLVDPEAVDAVRVRDRSVNKEALFISFATGFIRVVPLKKDYSQAGNHERSTTCGA